MNNETYIVRVKRPPGVTQGEMITYMRHALNGWKGGFDPADPLTSLPKVTISKPSKK